MPVASLKLTWSLVRSLGVSAVLAQGLLPWAHARADTWRGTAPFCAGECLPGEVKKGVSDSGDGGYCITGHKVLCGNPHQSCPVTSTQTDCFGVVMICDNGFSESPTGNWHSCDKYACGLCVGIGSLHPASAGAGFTPDTCKQGFVWREAVRNDHVCVTPETRSQAARDNAAAASRRSPGGGAYGPDSCMQGFVWREVVPSDHVCVSPEVRAVTQRDNTAAGERRAPPAVARGPDRCKQGFVWREALADDRVCVTPQTRTQAAADNAAAASRRLPNGGAHGPDTCRPGFVWREVVPSDHVCVMTTVRDSTRNDNRLAHERRASF